MVAVTRSRTTKVEVKSILETDDKIVVKKVTKKTTSTKKKDSTPASPKKKVKVDIEDVLSQKIVIPEDLKLPKDFIDFHTPEFIEGVNFLLEQDRSLYPLIVHAPFRQYAKENDSRNTYTIKKVEGDQINQYWYSLVSSVISQQISGGAARSIENKFRNLFEEAGEELVPANVLTKSDEQLRGVGFSFQKIKYVKHISEVFSDPTANLSQLKFYQETPLEEIVQELIRLKGIGAWSAKMFAIFTLREMDVFAHDDLGIARGMSKYLLRRPELYAEVKKHVDSDEDLKGLLKKKSLFANKSDSKRDWNPYHDVYVKHTAEKFSPYRSIFMFVLWRLSSTNVDVLFT
ncbi:3-methyladenine DNA glycosylase [Scheffersomyces amazonensis]|uniref:3-methyladenine DNA glycosylase n=1 Tax=Scheffersomyces amazonensis TaxID=1078765 RepID=UPI00315DD3F9